MNIILTLHIPQHNIQHAAQHTVNRALLILDTLTQRKTLTLIRTHSQHSRRQRVTTQRLTHRHTHSCTHVHTAVTRRFQNKHFRVCVYVLRARVLVFFCPNNALAPPVCVCVLVCACVIMADPKELSLPEIHGFMVRNGGKVTNHDLVKHFKRFLTNPATQGERKTRAPMTHRAKVFCFDNARCASRDTC